MNMGGRAFKNSQGTVLTTHIAREDVIPTVEWLETVTGLNLVDNILGSAGKADTAGDIDIAVDADRVDKNQFAKQLAEFVAQQRHDPKQWVKKSGISVHFKAPICEDTAKGHVQVDFMFGDPNWLKWSMTGGFKNSSLKGSHRHIILSSIAESKGLKWSWQRGLVDRETNRVITRDTNHIAKRLLGQTATAKDLEDPETIIDYVIKLPEYDQLIESARQTLLREGVELPAAGQLESYQPGTGAWFRRMIQVADSAA